MSTLLITHPVCMKHDMGEGHPEQPARLAYIERALAVPEFAGLIRAEAPVGSREQLLLAHPPDYIDMIEGARPRAEGEVSWLDADTSMAYWTYDAAMRAVGGATHAVDQVMTGRHQNAFCATRPPGHHAESRQAMGFCFFSNAAIAARHARVKHGAERIAIVDFDVHHGNGTQEIFWSARDHFYASTHQMPLYPGTGALLERGEHDNICNAPLRQGDGSGAFREAFTTRILPALDNFGFDILVVSAGFDAHRDDPLGGLALDDEDFAWVTEKLVESASRHCGGRLVSLLEGGYNLAALGRATARHVATLMAAS